MNLPPQVFILPVDGVAHAEGLSDSPLSLDAERLAQALASTPGWEDPSRAVIVARTHTRPLVGALGLFSSVEQEWLKDLHDGLLAASRNVKYITYQQAEKDCETLAFNLRNELDGAALTQAQFVAIPRGGLIILGLLSYFLGVRSEQLSGADESDNILVIVDDCIISGRRFREVLAHYPGHSKVVFAHLYSTPQVRLAIEHEAPHVTCIAAHDLKDHAPEFYGDDYKAWQARWKKRSQNRAYWHGIPDRVCFPWTEPDINVWNDTAGQSVHGWRVVPPELCIKNRVALKDGPPVFIQPQGKGPLRPAPDVIFGPVSDRILIARSDGEQCFDLQGTAAAMWQAIIEHGSIEAASKVLRSRYDVAPNQLHEDLDRFVDQLLERQLLIDADVPVQ